MKRFEVSAVDRDGRVRTFTYEADTENAAREQFRARAGWGARKARAKILRVAQVEEVSDGRQDHTERQR